MVLEKQMWSYNTDRGHCVSCVFNMSLISSESGKSPFAKTLCNTDLVVLYHYDLRFTGCDT
jgi:hypothetical protein